MLHFFGVVVVVDDDVGSDIDWSCFMLRNIRTGHIWTNRAGINGTYGFCSRCVPFIIVMQYMIFFLFRYQFCTNYAGTPTSSIDESSKTAVLSLT